MFLVFENDVQPHSIQTDSFLTPAKDSDLPLLVEEYHQLFRIIILHKLEDERERVKYWFNNKINNWNIHISRIKSNQMV